MDGTPVSAVDVARIEAEEQMQSKWRRAAVRVVAGAAHDAPDCRMLISVLGLEDDVKDARAELSTHPRRRRRSHAAA